MGIETGLIRLGRYFRFAKVDLDANWRSLDYCSIDVETTGLHLIDDEIVSIGIAQIHEGRIQTEENFYCEVRPRQLPSHQSVQIHGLRGIDLAKADPIESIIPDLLPRLRSRVFIAHAAWIEYAFLKSHLRGTRLTFSKEMIDTAALARAVGYSADDKGHEPSLEFLARSLQLPVYAPHNALGDALTTAVVFLALATELEREQLAKGASALSLRTLLDISVGNAKR